MLEPSIADFVARSGLAGSAEASSRPLAGGVSSDIWRIDAGNRCFVVKRALPALRVSQTWQAPLSRNANEVAWLDEVAAILPDAVPRVLFMDAGAATFAMEFVDYPVWKDELKAGRVDAAFAGRVGQALALIHAKTAGAASAAGRFDNAATFDALRVDPYLIATARLHPDLAGPLASLAQNTLGARRALVHGDVSPKNILVRDGEPIFLDAECACYGEPAFDLAFCLNHLLLKCVLLPSHRSALSGAFDALRDGYLSRIDWEAPADVEARTARLLPALFLARVDGKSPVEYITQEADKALVRQVARPFIAAPPATLADFRNAWMRTLANG